ncbi:MAG: CBS domain-containing protein [Candidatus Bathyarchaeota archaeon]|nr:CBS domain-containing protein [Candidatus Bathyarchaeota archaeon]
MRKLPHVSEIMSKPVVTIQADKSLHEAARLMKEKKIESLVVCWRGEAVGIITEKDFVRRVIAENLPLDTPVREVVSSPIVMVNAKASINEAARIMIENRVKRLPVKDGLKVVGMVTASDFIRHQSKMTSRDKILEILAGSTRE